MGCFKSCLVNCLTSCCLLIMAGVSFTFFDLGNAISGGLFVNLGSALDDVFQLYLGSTGIFASILIGGILGLFSILIFPIHWLLFYRPDDIGMAIALVLPWLISIGISGLIFAKSAKEGIFFGLYLAIGYIVIGISLYFGISYLLASAGLGSGIIDGLFLGLTNLHPVLAVLLSTLEGALVGGSLAALFGALKYKPTLETYTPKEKKPKKGKKEKESVEKTTTYSVDTTTGPKSTTGPKKCPNCGTLVDASLLFCTNCGNRV